MPDINKYITAHQPMSYATDHETPADVLDCSLGINPYGCPGAVAEALKTITLADLASYPHGSGLRDSIIRFWSPLAALKPENLVLGNGSMPLLTGINRLFLAPGKRVLGIIPGFSAFSDDVRVSGAVFTGLTFTPDMSAEDMAAGFMEKIREDKPDLICLENPNNPTGLALSLAAVGEIVALAHSLDTPIIVDEAYGDFLPPAQSAVCLVPRYPGLLVTRTFSKGLGLAGLRVGYVAASETVTENLLKVNSLFDANTPGRILAEAALWDQTFSQETVARVREGKARLLAALKNISVYPTSETTPISTLYTDQDIDLYGFLLRHGINAVPGVSFETVGKRGVRLILHRDIDELIRRISAADAALA